MATEVTVYGFETSNNMKVRIALGYKGIPYRFQSIDPTDRGKIVELSGQRLTPVLVHGDVVLCDSAAIMRYLDCNFADTPRLFGGDHAQQWEIEDWEMFARAVLAGPMMKVVHARMTAGGLDDGALARCAADFAAAVAKLTARLDGRHWLVGDRMTYADITAAAVMARIRTSELLPLPPVADALDGWQDRVMEYDGRCRQG